MAIMPTEGDRTMTSERKETLARQMATAIDAWGRCRSSANALQREWATRWQDRLHAMEYELPRGSGFDDYPTLDMDASNGERLVFTGSFHQMDEYGSYDGWRDYKITVKASLIHGLTVSCNVRGDLGDMIHEAFDIALRQEFPVKQFAAGGVT